MKILPILCILLLMMITLSGCEDINKKLDDINSQFGKGTIKEAVQEKVCPVCETCEPPITMDVVSYLFDKQKENLLYFMTNSEVFLYCQLPIIEDKDITNAILNLDSNLRTSSNATVRVIVDKTGTMDYCQTSCIPKLKSYYNLLFSKGVFIRYKDIHYAYCVNDKGVFVTSKILSDSGNYNDYALFIQSKQLSKVFKEQFEKVWNDG